MDIYFEYGEKEINYLKAKDDKLRNAIDIIGKIDRKINPNLFSSLVNTIVGQQISTKAQKTIWKRISDTIENITPESIYNLSIDELQQFGISFRKAGYIRNSAEMILSNELDIHSLYEMEDQAVIKSLIKLPGIGVWTAEMLMLFTMQRSDILSFGDLGIQRGMKILYGYDEISKSTFSKHQQIYSPYGSVASLYLWAVASGEFTL